MKGDKVNYAKQLKKNTIVGKSIHLNTKAAAHLSTMEPSKRHSQEGFGINRITLDVDSAANVTFEARKQFGRNELEDSRVIMNFS